MAINLATKYSGKVDEVIINGALSAPSVNNDYDWIGAQTVKVYSFDPVSMNNYIANGTNRYGTPEELQDTTQEMTLKNKRSFTFTIDKTNKMDTPEGVRDAAKALRRQIDEVIIPELDTYRFTVIADNAGEKIISAIDATNAYDVFLAANQAIDEKDIPSANRVANVSPEFLKLIKQDDNFVKASDIAQEMLIKGQVGEIDGVAIVKVASKRLPAGLAFEITHKLACVAPVKLEEYKIHVDPPGIAGNLVEGLVYYDAFVLNKKKDMIVAVYGKAAPLTVTAKTGGTATSSIIDVKGNTNGGKLVYKGDFASASAASGAVDLGDDVSNWAEVPANKKVTTASGKFIAVAVAVDGKAVAGGSVAAVVTG